MSNELKPIVWLTTATPVPVVAATANPQATGPVLFHYSPTLVSTQPQAAYPTMFASLQPLGPIATFATPPTLLQTYHPLAQTNLASFGCTPLQPGVQPVVVNPPQYDTNSWSATVDTTTQTSGSEDTIETTEEPTETNASSSDTSQVDVSEQTQFEDVPTDQVIDEEGVEEDTLENLTTTIIEANQQDDAPLATKTPSPPPQSSPPKNPFTTPTTSFNRKEPRCCRCRNHGQISSYRYGHIRYCPFRNCRCVKCVLIERRRKVLAAQMALRRSELNNEMLAEIEANNQQKSGYSNHSTQR